VKRKTSHLKVVGVAAPGRETIGPYELRHVLEDQGHPQLRLAWREEPHALQGRYAVLLIEHSPGRPPSADRALLRDAARAMGVRHPGVVRVRDLVGDRDGLAIATDHVPGLSVETILTRLDGRPLPREVAIPICATLLEGLDDIHGLPRETGRHSLAAAHGDIRARNVLVGDDASVRILGFGLPHPKEAFGLGEHSADRSSTTEDLWFPTPDGDQFAAGLLLLRMLASDGSEGLTLSRGHGPKPDAIQAGLRRFELTDPLLPTLLRLLANRPEHRFQSCARAAEDLRRLQGDDERLILARFAARLHEEESQETDLTPATAGPDEATTDEVSALDLSVTAPSPDTNLNPDTTAPWTGEVGQVGSDELIEVHDSTSDELGPSLDRPVNEWATENDEEEARTVPAGAPYVPRTSGPGSVSVPGRTVPYSPAFVPRASKWRPGDDEPLGSSEDPDLASPWAAGLMSGTMAAVGPKASTAPAPSADHLDGETRPFSPAPVPPAATFQSEITAIPVPRARKRKKRRRKRRAKAPTPPVRSSRLSQALERTGLVKTVQSSWVLTAFTLCVLALLIYAVWEISLRL
jgi:hypothetical protein